MPKLIFYRQKRFDGAIRTGIELDEETIAHKFEDVPGDHDPTLLWYVDLRCSGAGIPADPDDAIHWFLEHSEIIRDGFARFANQLQVGIDFDLSSLRWNEFSNVPKGVSLEIACSAVRRVEAREMASMLTEIGERWDDLIKWLELPEEIEEYR